jgi:hypothetical protein
MHPDEQDGQTTVHKCQPKELRSLKSPRAHTLLQLDDFSGARGFGSREPGVRGHAPPPSDVGRPAAGSGTKTFFSLILQVTFGVCVRAGALDGFDQRGEWGGWPEAPVRMSRVCLRRLPQRSRRAAAAPKRPVTFARVVRARKAISDKRQQLSAAYVQPRPCARGH